MKAVLDIRSNVRMKNAGQPVKRKATFWRVTFTMMKKKSLDSAKPKKRIIMSVDSDTDR